MKNIILKVYNEGFDVYVKCKSSNKYLKHHFLHIKETDINANLYRIVTSHAVYFEDGTEKALYDSNIVVANGEWECAIKEVGAQDFFGGFHGDENLIEVSLFADKKEITLDKEYECECDEIIFYQKAYLNRCDTIGDNVAYHIKRYVITYDGGIAIDQSVEWIKDVNLECGFLGMLPVMRDSGSYQITDRALALDGPNKDVLCDVSDISSKTVISELNENTSRVKLYGEKSGFSVVVTHLLSPNLEGKHFYLKIRPWDNKFYFRCCSSVTAKKGDLWRSYTHYDFDIK